ncbi:unnamed protein product, partial [Medioppia subpectinata]
MTDNYGYNNNELAIAWTNLGFVQKSLFGKRVKTILDSLNGQINFHTLTALMGPSGAGKTTLLKCVNMRSNSNLTADTQMFVNKYTDLRTCFIMQSSDEHILKGLTVSLCDDFEPLDINGNFDHNLNVRRILSELLLEDCADTCVQTCSGGEQKRLTVGLELVQQNKPNLMCIDEPTSGLDSNAAELVIQCLRELSERHRMAIVTSIHQPNSLLLSMFDQLYVLSKGGHCVFAGRP